MPYMYIYIYTAMYTAKRYAKNYVTIVYQGWDRGSGFVAEPVAGAMAGAPLSKNDGDWVPKRSSFMCVCVANMTGKRFLSSMTVRPFGLWTTSFFYQLHSKGKLGLCIFI